MNILFDIGHPAHVHYFKNLILLLKKENNNIVITARNKDIAHQLLVNLNFDFIDRGVGSNSFIGKIFFLIKNNWLIYKVAKEEKIELFIGFGSPYASQVAYFINKPSIILDDTENAKIGQLFYKKFASVILSPSTFKASFGSYHLKFKSYMELAYLHPKYFKPNYSSLAELNLKEGEKFVIVRFVSWNANHDIGHNGMQLKNKIKLVNELSKKAKVFITSESTLPSELEKYRFSLSPDKMHDALYFASLMFGESATMASESAVLGTYAIYIDGRGYTNEQEKQYGIVKNFTESEKDQLASIDFAINLLNEQNLRKESRKKSKLIIKEKINLTDFLFWFIENYPQSAKIIKENPDYQNIFK